MTRIRAKPFVQIVQNFFLVAPFWLWHHDIWLLNLLLAIAFLLALDWKYGDLR